MGVYPAEAQQWTAVVLHPAYANYSEVTCLTATRQGGNLTRDQVVSEGGFWAGNADRWMPLFSSFFVGSVLGMDGDRQVGTFQGAAMWQGTPKSFLSLHPAGVDASGATAIRGNMQVGLAYLPSSNEHHAALWYGTAASFVDLHPPGAVRSLCRATDGTLQGGFVVWPVIGQRAAIWNGSSQTCITLSSLGSAVYGMAPGVQVGEVFPVGGVHAALWRGTPESFIDLNPPGGTTRLFATTGRIHVGQGVISGPGISRALINFGTADAWHDLHQYLPPHYTSFSAAQAVYEDGDTIYAGGYAIHGDRQAILWIGKVPCYPNCDNSTGSPHLTANDFQCFLNRFITGDGYANCDRSTGSPSLTANDFQCFLNRYASGCP
ncbi:MAG: hypothetical protein KF678_12675 [Phycisphaeraceae bacterium]|nr:hypothetical protein [Phycisphaeraceae bacterium]